jgi:hypothetical protein
MNPMGARADTRKASLQPVKLVNNVLIIRFLGCKHKIEARQKRVKPNRQKMASKGWPVDNGVDNSWMNIDPNWTLWIQKTGQRRGKISN